MSTVLKKRITKDEITAEFVDDLFNEVDKFRREHTYQGKPLSYQRVAKQIQASAATLSQVKNHAYDGDWKFYAHALHKWLLKEINKAETQSEPEFVWTKVACEIRDTAVIAEKLGRIGLVYGEPGIGKTKTLEVIAADMNAVHVTLHVDCLSPTRLMKKIAKSAGLKSFGGYGSNSMLEQLIDHFEGTNRLLIVDQIHHMMSSRSDLGWYALTDLMDQTRCPQLWVSTMDLVDHFLRQEADYAKQPLGQIRRRICKATNLHLRTYEDTDGGRGEPLFSVEEIREVFRAIRPRLTAAAEKLVFNLANSPGDGGLDFARNVIELAKSVAQKQNKPSITRELLDAALRHVVSPGSHAILIRKSGFEVNSNNRRKTG